MAKETFYRQCALRNGNRTTLSWIPERFAVPGKVLRLQRHDGAWDHGWVVEAAYSRCAEDQLLDPHRAIRRHRRNTGDDLPKETRD
jgi:hypothetical protein